MKMRIALVVAASENNLIGQGNALPWRLPADMKRFKELTMGKPIVMGRKTYESIGRPLPGRANIVISRTTGLAIPGCTVYGSLDAAFAALHAAPEICVIGGAEIYRSALPFVDVIYLTRVHTTLGGDVYLPPLPMNEWRETHRERHAADERHLHAFSFITLQRN